MHQKKTSENCKTNSVQIIYDSVNKMYSFPTMIRKNTIFSIKKTQTGRMICGYSSNSELI